MDKLPAKLEDLKEAAAYLAWGLCAYQRALAEARKAGATWEQLSSAAGIPIATARSRHKTAVHGGEMHLHLDPLKEKRKTNALENTT